MGRLQEMILNVKYEVSLFRLVRLLSVEHTEQRHKQVLESSFEFISSLLFGYSVVKEEHASMKPIKGKREGFNNERVVLC